MMDLKTIGIGGLGSLGASAVALAHFGVANLAEIQGALIPLAFTVAPEVPYLDAQLLQRAALGVTALFVAVTLAKVGADAVRRFRK